MAIGWDDLAAASLARQFPDDPGTVAGRVEAIGDLQTQTARSAFIGLGARFPGVTHAEITAAYDAGEIVRGSTIRGTVHTATPEGYTVLAEATRVGQHPRWARLLGLSDVQLADLWTSLEVHAREWRTPDELRAHVDAWLGRHAPAALDAAAAGPGRYLGFAHGGLVRRPASGDRWEGQGKPAYGTFDRTGPATLTDVVRHHLRAHGPSSRQDVAWWAGIPLGAVSDGLAGLDVVEQEGPDGRAYVDLPDAPAPRDLPGVRLLPEFDALLCGYDSKARDRFVSPEHHRRLWNESNGMLLPPLLVDGRITGFWRAAGTTRRRPLEVTWFARTRRPRRAELDRPVTALEAALGITVTEVTLTREAV
ncbi:MAG TPA: winged helix DNA-binding domain-containing protein [Nocardioides sp.]|nr:winged helix DNA-binding domain-containing protein [Nocardioides sp.]